MRITNKIMQNNSLTNINNNKILQDKLSTMISTQKKIARPSDDPIIALRSLRLRTSVNQTEQYLEKNVEDAKSWLKVTEDAIGTLTDVVTDIRKQYTKGTNDPLKIEDRDIILENLEALAAEVYTTGNVDFAGRSVFTGFRTDSTLTFQKDENVDYSITEKMTTEDIDKTNYVHCSGATTEQDVYTADISRIRLSYDALKDGSTVTLNFTDPVTVSNGAVGTPTHSVNTVTATSVSLSSDPYKSVYDNPDSVVFVAETGEVLLGANVASQLTGSNDFTVDYNKNAWSKGDLKPEHYFKCTNNDESIDYNFTSGPDGEIEYNIGVNQNIRINTTASECFKHNISRDIDDVVAAIHGVEDIEKTLADLNKKLKETPETDTATITDLEKKIDAAEKAQTFLNEKLHNLFSGSITDSDGYLKSNTLALTDCGTRSKRLELIENRLTTQLSTLKELKSENEDADLAETAIKLSSAEYAYDAALMATGKIMKNSLMNYI